MQAPKQPSLDQVSPILAQNWPLHHQHLLMQSCSDLSHVMSCDTHLRAYRQRKDKHFFLVPFFFYLKKEFCYVFSLVN